MLLLRAAAELRPSILDTVPALLDAMLSTAPPATSTTATAGIVPKEPNSAASSAVSEACSGGAGEATLSPSDAALLLSLRAVLYGGAQLASTTARSFARSGVTLHSQYGQTELGRSHCPWRSM